MKKQANSLQTACLNYQTFAQRLEMFMASTIFEDRRQQYFDFFLERLLPDERKDAFNIERMTKRYFVEGDTHQKRGN